jgi:hypothetical protein
MHPFLSPLYEEPCGHAKPFFMTYIETAFVRFGKVAIAAIAATMNCGIL